MRISLGQHVNADNFPLIVFAIFTLFATRVGDFLKFRCVWCRAARFYNAASLKTTKWRSEMLRVAVLKWRIMQYRVNRVTNRLHSQNPKAASKFW